MAETVNSAFMGQPAGGEDPSLGDDRIRAFKEAWKERLEKEHYLDLTEAGAQPRQGLHRTGSAVAFYQSSAPTQRNGVALGSSDAGLLWMDTTNSRLSVWSGSAWVTTTEFYEYINTTKTYGALGWENYIYLGSSAVINISAGAAVTGSRLLIWASSSGGTVKFSSSSSPVTIGVNALEVIWNGTKWSYSRSAMPIRLALVTTAGSAALVVPISGPYTYVLQGGGGAGGGTDLVSTTDTNLAMGGGGGAGAWQKWRSWITGDTSLTYVCGAGGTGAAGATGGNGTASSWNSKTADYGKGGVGTPSSAYGGFELNGAAGTAVITGTGLVDFYQPGSPRYFNGTGYQAPIVVRYDEPTYYYNYFMAAASGMASKYGPGGFGGYIYGEYTTTNLGNTSAVGSAATNPGSGGGGAISYKNTTGRAGGDGADGLVHICLGYEVV